VRPVRRGEVPVPGGFANYRDAFPDLVGRLGMYCSYCERRIPTGLAVEHMQPKSLAAYAHLEGEWTNFLLACVNCNSVKGCQDIRLDEYVWPDRDDTFAIFEYTDDGRIVPSQTAIDAGIEHVARATLELTGLDRAIAPYFDDNGIMVQLDRVAQRMNARLIAEDSLADLELTSDRDSYIRAIVRIALAEGFFSVWMKVFFGHQDVLDALIDAFKGTRASGCFAGRAVDRNPDKLPFGGRPVLR
jgi:uncharacterized protein (TIGR02646 family)